jgi:signal transduction histidine kinase
MGAQSIEQQVLPLLERNREAKDKLLRLVKNILRSGTRADGLIRDLLDFARVEAGTLQVELGEELVGDLVDELFSMVRGIAEQRQIALQSEVDNSLYARCDRPRIIQVLGNLVGNALKFTPEGGKVTVRANSFEGEEVLISVSDTGPGISEEHLERVFDRYWQAEETRRQGTGLGLAIAKGIIEAHGGRIWARSRINEGSTFLFTLIEAAPTQTGVGPLEEAPRPEPSKDPDLS